MYASTLNESPDPSLQKAAKEFIDSNRKEQIKKEIESLIDDEYLILEEGAAEHLSSIAAARATRFIEHLLAGDQEAAKELFEVGRGQYQTIGYDAGKPWAKLIHGGLFETSSIKLRRELVEAHADLLRSERIADLESIVKGLTQQILQLESDLARCRERL